MTTDWTPLRRCLADLRVKNQPLEIWWRDDDATEPTKALDRLEKLAQMVQVPVHLAVIPKPATQELAACVLNSDNLVPLVHGWQHANRAPKGQKNAEFGHVRADAEIDIAAGYDRLSALFGKQLLPVFVPPWNRIHDSFLPALSRQGFKAVSTFTSRTTLHPAPRLTQINTHIDPIDWHGTRGLGDPDRLLSELIALLKKRQRGDKDSTEPLGYLTHHLVHTEAIWDFSQRLLLELREGGATVAALAPLMEPQT